MSELFMFSEINARDIFFQKYPALKIDKNPAFYIILRGLIGDLRITQTFRDVSFNQTENYLDITYEKYLPPEEAIVKESDVEFSSAIINMLSELEKVCKPNLDILPSYISDSFILKDLEDVLRDRVIIHRNKSFFEALNNEFCNFYYQTSKENHTVAFLHLYRILEYVSYTFPMMYAASTKDFAESFDSLKTLFTGDKDQGELKVFKLFIKNVLSVEKDYARLTIDIPILSDHEHYNERIYNTILTICEASIFNKDRNIMNKRISIKFPEFSSFIITIRNRFFHLKNSQGANIHSVDIVDSDYFFELINRKCAYYLGLITIIIINKNCLQK